MSQPIVSNICPVCEKPIICEGFSYHSCDDQYTITLNGQFHASRDNVIQARTYIRSTARRQEQAGIEVMIETDPNDEYYNTSYVSEDELAQERQELLAAAVDWAAHEHGYANALDRLRGLGGEMQAHEDRVRASDDHVPVISLVETPLRIRRAA